MWNHLDPERLFELSEGTQLDEAERSHFDHCEFCQEMLRFFQTCLDLDDSHGAAAA